MATPIERPAWTPAPCVPARAAVPPRLRHSVLDVARAKTKALHLEFGQFPLEVALRGTDPTLPCVLVDSAAPDASVVSANAPAAGLGARAGMPVKVLSAFGPHVRPVARNPAAEVRSRGHLDRWLRALGATIQEMRTDDGSLTLNALVATARPDAWLARCRRDLRAFGFRARLDFADANPIADRPGGRDSRDGNPGGFFSQIDLPWPAHGPRELHPAVTRLLEELRVIHEAEGRPLRAIHWTFQDIADARHHHVFDAEATLRPLVRFALQTRERLCRMPGSTPFRAVGLKAIFG